MSARRRSPKGARPYPGPNRFDLNGETFAKLLEDLEKLLYKAGATFVDLTELLSRVKEAILSYDADLYMEDYLENLTLHKLEDTLPLVIEILKCEANEHPVIMALGAVPDSRSVDIEHGVDRRKALISDLEKIAAIPPPATRGRGRPKGEALHRFIHRLAKYWVTATGRPFTSFWPKDFPVSLGAQFVNGAQRKPHGRTFPDHPHLRFRRRICYPSCCLRNAL
jgi:hypothetical protein